MGFRTPACCPRRSHPRCWLLPWQPGAGHRGSRLLALAGWLSWRSLFSGIVHKVPPSCSEADASSAQAITSPAGHLCQRCRPPAVREGARALRRCIRVGIIVAPLLDGGPSFKAEQELRGAGSMRGAIRPRRPSRHWGCRLTSRCSGPSDHKVPIARTHQLGGRQTCARIGFAAAAELGR